MKFTFRGACQIVAFVFFVGILTSCSSKEYSFQYVDERTEDFGNHLATIEVYALGDTLNLEEIKGFCLEKKQSAFGQALIFIVFFDSKVHARVPKNPISAFYGIDESALSHIKAYYEYSKNANTSTLYVFEENAYTSSPIQYQL